MRILLSAYACEPGRGSEPGVGWNWALHLSRLEEVWVITRANNRGPIEQALAKTPLPGLHPVYFDLPRWMRFWKKGSRGLRLYYYLWQFGAWRLARKLHREIGFDVAHHVTFVKYWMPSFMALLDTPFVWGPVGGGESAPRRFWHSFSLRGKIYETARDIARSLGSLDPFVRWTARRSALAMATTAETEAAVKVAGAPHTMVYSEAGISDEEIERLGRLPMTRAEGRPFRLVSVGSLLHLKAFELSLRAFARFASGQPDAEYWVIGSGPERERLEWLTGALRVRDKVTFWGAVPRATVLEKLAECDAMVHPTLHDSGGWVCLESMAAGRPVVCLNLGGPGVQITEETGIKIPAVSPEQAVRDMAAAFDKLAGDPELCRRMGLAGRRRVAEQFAWSRKAASMLRVYEQVGRPAVQTKELAPIRQHRAQSI
jgi:glycosyltransferase involved in cell wall biosynthesis